MLTGEGGLRFGRTDASRLERCRPQPGDMWFLDEVFVRVRVKLHGFWRAVDRHGNALDALLQRRRRKKVAKRFLVTRAPIHSPFRLCRQLLSANEDRASALSYEVAGPSSQANLA